MQEVNWHFFACNTSILPLNLDPAFSVSLASMEQEAAATFEQGFQVSKAMLAQLRHKYLS